MTTDTDNHKNFSEGTHNPQHRTSPPTTASSTQAPKAPIQGVPALIIEDDPAVAALIAGVAEKRGHKSIIANTAEEGQEIWLKQKQPLIILDLNLPGMSGTDFCKWLRSLENGKDVFVLISTANNKVETFHAVLKAGANDYIPKPLQPALLAIRLDVAEHTIKQILEKRGLEGEVGRNERRFQLISENSRDLVCTHSPNGEILYVSPSCQNLLGLSPHELLGKTFDNIKLDKEASPLNTAAITDEENGQLESIFTWRTKHKDGQEVWLETYTQSGHDIEDKEVKEIYSYSRDVTDRIREEQQIRILTILGESTDSESFLKSIIEEMEQKMDASVCIHIHATSPDSLSYCINGDGVSEETANKHKSLNRETPHDKALFQCKNAAGVFNYIEGTDDLESVITQPIPGTFGRPIGKITIFSSHKISDSERTRAILLLCATKIGNVLEDHVTKY
jgi:PAS domain S-box-containing protein